MTVAELYSLIDDLCGTDSTSYTEADKLRHLNIAYGEVMGDILEINPDANFGGEISTSDLVAYDGLVAGDLGYLGEYPLPTDFLRWVRLELKLDGTNWSKASVYDSEENPLSETDVTTLIGAGSSATPRVDIFRNSMFVRPLPNQDVSGGIKLWYLSRQTALTDGSPAFESNYHPLLAYKAARIRAISKPDVYNQTWKNNINNEILTITDKMQSAEAKKLRRPMKISVKKVNYK